jgi:acetyl-CoA carboxylase beta subunit
MLDLVVDRRELKSTLAQTLKFMYDADREQQIGV